jgi:molybdenum-dependent DNA-binding transcriptional regulator ModE
MGLLTPEERARLTDLQDKLIERFVAHKDAVADGLEARAKELEAEIDDLLREKEEIEKWATFGTA